MISEPKPRSCAGCGRRIYQERRGRTRLWCDAHCADLMRQLGRAERRMLAIRQELAERGRRA